MLAIIAWSQTDNAQAEDQTMEFPLFMKNAPKALREKFHAHFAEVTFESVNLSCLLGKLTNFMSHESDPKLRKAHENWEAQVLHEKSRVDELLKEIHYSLSSEAQKVNHQLLLIILNDRDSAGEQLLKIQKLLDRTAKHNEPLHREMQHHVERMKCLGRQVLHRIMTN